MSALSKSIPPGGLHDNHTPRGSYTPSNRSGLLLVVFQLSFVLLELTFLYFWFVSNQNSMTKDEIRNYLENIDENVASLKADALVIHADQWASTELLIDVLSKAYQIDANALRDQYNKLSEKRRRTLMAVHWGVQKKD